MMKCFVSLVAIFFTQSSVAAITSLQGGLGLLNGIPNINIDVDFQQKRSHSFGGFLIFSPEQDDRAPNVSRGQFWSLGADMKVFFGPRNWKMYVAPGVGIIAYDTVGGGDSETSFGTLMKVGSLYRLAPNMYLGLEQMFLQTWLSPKGFGGYYLLTNLAFRINF
jgi:hypothetical protein